MKLLKGLRTIGQFVLLGSGLGIFALCYYVASGFNGGAVTRLLALLQGHLLVEEKRTANEVAVQEIRAQIREAREKAIEEARKQADAEPLSLVDMRRKFRA